MKLAAIIALAALAASGCNQPEAVAPKQDPVVGTWSGPEGVMTFQEGGKGEYTPTDAMAAGLVKNTLEWDPITQTVKWAGMFEGRYTVVEGGKSMTIKIGGEKPFIQVYKRL